MFYQAKLISFSYVGVIRIIGTKKELYRYSKNYTSLSFDFVMGIHPSKLVQLALNKSFWQCLDSEKTNPNRGGLQNCIYLYYSTLSNVSRCFLIFLIWPQRKFHLVAGQETYLLDNFLQICFSIWHIFLAAARGEFHPFLGYRVQNNVYGQFSVGINIYLSRYTKRLNVN